jgi:hypothetical protein
MNRINNRIAKGVLALTAVVLLGGVPLARAQEETGKLIEKLVLDVDKQLSSLEALTDKQSDQKETWKKELEAEYVRYDQATNSTDKAAIRSEIVGTLANLNKADRAETKATTDAIVNICDAMRKLQAVVQSSPAMNPEKLSQQKAQLGAFIKNVAKVVRAVEAIDTKPAAGRNNALKNSVAMLHRQLADPLTGTASALDRINETMQTLEGVAVQLEIVQAALESEHTMLMTATHVQTVDLALLRLGRARLGADSVADIPMNRNTDVVERVRRSWRSISGSEATLMGSSQSSVAEDFDAILSE